MRSNRTLLRHTHNHRCTGKTHHRETCGGYTAIGLKNIEALGLQQPAVPAAGHGVTRIGPDVLFLTNSKVEL